MPELTNPAWWALGGITLLNLGTLVFVLGKTAGELAELKRKAHSPPCQESKAALQHIYEALDALRQDTTETRTDVKWLKQAEGRRISGDRS